MEDIAPKLLEKIRDEFKEKIDKSEKITKLYARVRDGTATYQEANEFAIEAGEVLARVFQDNISSGILPDEKMYFNIADRVIRPMMEGNYELVADVTEQIQKSLNQQAKIGLKAIRPDLNEDRIVGIINKVSNAEKYDDVAWVLDEPVVNFSQSIVDDSIRANAEFQSKAGMRPVIIRKSRGDCCDWCKQLAGIYSYPDDVPSDLYRRHSRCRCTVEYDPKDGKGKVQNVHTKRWNVQEESDKIEKRKAIGIKNANKETPKEKEKRITEENGLDLAGRLAGHPKTLGAYTPKGLKDSLERAGYDVKPMNSGNFKGVPFEEGGGYKINFGGDGILMYHPEKRSHHQGAYYKISTGKGGTHRYDIQGNEIEKDK